VVTFPDFIANYPRQVFGLNNGAWLCDHTDLLPLGVFEWRVRLYFHRADIDQIPSSRQKHRLTLILCENPLDAYDNPLKQICDNKILEFLSTSLRDYVWYQKG
jgi:hypothetical protein